MRILLLVVYYLPSTIASAKLIHDLALEMHHLGHEPIVVAPDENITRSIEITYEEDIKVIRIRTGRIKSASKLVRAFNEARLSGVIWKNGRYFFKDNPCDLIIYYSPTIFFGSLVAKLKRFFNCPSYLILRDIFPQWALDAGIIKKGIVWKYFRLKEIEQYDAADFIGVQSPANLRYFSENGLHKYNLEVLYNWARPEEKCIPCGSYREMLGLKDKIVFFYGGNIGIAQDIDNIVRLAENLRKESKAYFLLVGSGSEVNRLRSVIADKYLNNIIIHEQVNQQQYLTMLSEFDVGLVSLDQRLKTHNFPGKILSYMYNSIPILASINRGNDLMEILEKYQAGLVSINGDDKHFYNNAIRLLQEESLRHQIGKNARFLLESTFSVTKAAQQILSHFKN